MSAASAMPGPGPDGTIDPGIAGAVDILRAAGIETTESCQGGVGHAFPEPTVRFDGMHYEGMRALAVAQAAGLPVSKVRRIWCIIDGEAVGPEWEIVFHAPVPRGVRSAARPDRGAGERGGQRSARRGGTGSRQASVDNENGPQ